MSKKRAFVRYTKSGEIVPGSLIITTNGGYPDKSSLWKEVTVDQCCDGGSSECPLLEIQVYYAENQNDICIGQGVLGTYFIDCSSDSFLPSIYLDANGTTPAPTGHYSFVNTITNTILYVVNGVSQYFSTCA